MRLVVYRLATELRHRWATGLIVALLIGVASGAVMASVAGIRRADTVAERLANASSRSDAFTDSGYFYGTHLPSRRIASLPQVVSTARHKDMVVNGRTKSGDPIWPDESPDALTVYEPAGRPRWRSQDRPVVVSGRCRIPAAQTRSCSTRPRAEFLAAASVTASICGSSPGGSWAISTTKPKSRLASGLTR